MIHTENITTKVEFGNEVKANILVNGKFRKLILQELITQKKIGDEAKPEDAKDLPKIEIEFNSTLSIDVMIEALTHIKNNFYPPPEDNYALAC